MNKKAIIILSGLAILTLVITGLFWLFSSREPAGGEVGAPTGLFPSGEDRPSRVAAPSGDLFPGGMEEKRDFVQLTQNAIAGAAMSSTSVRYVEKSTGHIYEISPQGKDRQRLSNTTILKIFEVLWSSSANKLIVKYFEDDSLFGAVKIFSADIDPVTNSIGGVFLPRSIKEVAVSRNRERVFYLQESGSGILGVAADFDNQDRNPVFFFPFGEFNIKWLNKNIITLLTKPASEIGGFLYFFDPYTEKLEKIIGDVRGLTALASLDGKKIIYSQSVRNGFGTKIFNKDKKETEKFGLRTLPEKCAWSELNKGMVYCGVPKTLPRVEYPDAWYQGKISFTDSVWMADVLTGETTLLLEKTNADITDIFLSPDENYLFFTNKKDGTLWSLEISQ